MLEVPNTNKIKFAANSLKISFLISIIVVSYGIARSPLISRPQISTAVAFDLTLSVPFFYWLFIRKTEISKLTIVPFFVFGIIFASFILPIDNRAFLESLKLFALPAVELGVLGYVGFIVYKSGKSFRWINRNRRDALENLRETLTQEFSNKTLANALAFEIAEIYYALICWKKRGGDANFSYHKQTGALALLSIFGFLAAAETLVLHFLIVGWNAATAWVLTILSVYFLFQLFAHGKAIVLRPLELSKDELFVRCGMLGDALVRLENIEKIELMQTVKPGALTLAPLGSLTAANLQISLRQDAVLNGIYGKQKKFKTLCLSVDEAAEFKLEVEKRIAAIEK